MIWYKKDKKDDPYNKLWSTPQWLYPFENADKIVFPSVITVEPTNICQNKCLYCLMQLMDRQTGFMSLRLMELISKEASQHGAAVRHGGFGEPLIHPKITEIVAISKKLDVLTTIFSNCSLLTEDMMKAFVDSGLDEIRFSSSGITPQEHNEIRRNSDYYDDFDKKTKMAFNIREKMNATRPFLTIYTNVIDYDSNICKENIEAYVQKYIQYADKIDIDLTMFSRVKDLDHVKPFYEKQNINEQYKRCVTLFHKVIVHWNGDVFVCDIPYNREESHYLGNLLDKGFTVEKGFASNKMKWFRENMSFSLNHKQFKLCESCYSNTTKWDRKKEL